MGSGTSRFETRWWEAKVQRKVATTKHTSKVVVICSLIPGVDDTAMIDCLKERSDLDTLFELYCRSQGLHGEQQANPTVDVKANELWRALHMPLESGESSWDPNWQPPFKGGHSEIAAEFHATVSRAIFRVPFFELVKYALGYDTKMSIPDAACDIRDCLRTVFQDCPMIKDMYIEVGKVLTQQHHPLAHWIIASSLEKATFTLHEAIALNLEPIQRIFAKHNLDLVLKRLAPLDKRFSYVSQRYNWQKWSTDLDFWECVNQMLWSGECATPFMPPHLSTVDRDERLDFLEGLKERPQSSSGGQYLQHSIRQGLEMSGVVPTAVGGFAVGGFAFGCLALER